MRFDGGFSHNFNLLRKSKNMSHGGLKYMEFVPAKCTQCNADITVDPAKEAANCGYCGTAFIVDKAIKNYNIANAQINAQTVNVYNSSNTELESLMKRGQLSLESGDWTDAFRCFDKVLDISPEYAPAYIGRLCSRWRINGVAGLASCDETLDNEPDFKNALRFAEADYRAKIEGYYSQAAEKRQKRQRLKEECIKERQIRKAEEEQKRAEEYRLEQKRIQEMTATAQRYRETLKERKEKGLCPVCGGKFKKTGFGWRKCKSCKNEAHWGEDVYSHDSLKGKTIKY
jgi:tetratricopeptide (TPR) repeat protein